jgi:hypothetical protein
MNVQPASALLRLSRNKGSVELITPNRLREILDVSLGEKRDLFYRR